MLKIYVLVAPSLVLIRKPNFPDTHVRHPSRWPTQTASIPYAKKPLYFKALKRRQMEPASWEDSRLCIKFRIKAKKEKGETQAILATPDSPIATGLQYFPVRNMRMVGGSQLFDHTKYPYWTPPQVPSDRRNIHYWTWYLHKLPTRGVNAYNRLYEPISRIDNFVDRITEGSNIVKSGLGSDMQKEKKFRLRISS